jgi:hypothetical protein
MPKYVKALFFLLLTASLADAQSLLAGNKLWKTNHVIYPRGNRTEWDIDYRVLSDTTIGGKTYSQVATSKGMYFYLREQNDSVLLLENTAEILLYDFNIKVGDSISLNSSQYGQYYYKAIYEDSTYVALANERRITIRTNRSHPFYNTPYDIYWIKRVGDRSYGLLSLYAQDLGFGISFKCMSENNTTIYGQENCYPNGLNEIAYEKPKFNFCGENLCIDSKINLNSGAYIELYDCTGKLVFKEDITGATYISLPTNEINPGFYICILNNKNEKTISKLMKSY